MIQRYGQDDALVFKGRVQQGVMGTKSSANRHPKDDVHRDAQLKPQQQADQPLQPEWIAYVAIADNELCMS